MMWSPKVISCVPGPYSHLQASLRGKRIIDTDMFAGSNITDCSRNPARHSDFMGPLPHFFLMFGRVPSPYSHLQASLRGKRIFDTDII